MDEFKQNIRREIEGRGLYQPEAWKQDSDKLFTPEQVRGLYHEMAERKIIPDKDQDFVFVSPTANIPTHERTFFEEDQKERKGRGTFLVGDISRLNVDAADFQKISETGVFQYFRWDAEYLPIKNGSVDMLWDRKGWLWYLAEKNDSQRFMETIQQYYDLLRDGGCVVVDNINWYEKYAKSMGGNAVLRSEFLMLLGASGLVQTRPSILIPHPQATEYERSTTDAMARMHYEVDEDLFKKFEMSTMGSGAGRVRIMRKIPQGAIAERV